MDAPRGAVIYLHPGRLYVGRDNDPVATILGSCVAVCLHDAQAGVGGVNHFLLPDASPDDPTSSRYAGPAIEQLIRGMVAAGAKASRLEASVIGGASVLSAFAHDPNHLGLRNAAAATELLARHRIPVLASDVGGRRGRRLTFVPRDGTHQVRLLGVAHHAPA